MNDREMTPQQLRQEAAKADQRAAESWDRSDTDGFLTQWASAAEAARLRLQAEINENGGKAEFPALFDLSGNFVPARLIETRYGMSWMIVDGIGRSTGKFVGAFPVRASTLERKGYTEGTVLRPAVAAHMGDMAGSVYSKATVPSHLVPADDEIVCRNRFQADA